MHLTNAVDNIYLQLTLTNWGAEGGVGDHTFGYIRTTAAVAPPTPTANAVLEDALKLYVTDDN